MGALTDAVFAFQQGREYKRKKDEYKYQVAQRESDKRIQRTQKRLMTSMLLGEVDNKQLQKLNPMAYMKGQQFMQKQKEFDWAEADRDYLNKEKGWKEEDREFIKEERAYQQAIRPTAKEAKKQTLAEQEIKNQTANIKSVAISAQRLKGMGNNPVRQEKFLKDHIAKLDKQGRESEDSQYALKMLQSGDTKAFNSALDESINLERYSRMQTNAKGKRFKSYAKVLIQDGGKNYWEIPYINEQTGEGGAVRIPLEATELTPEQKSALEVSTYQAKLQEKEADRVTTEYRKKRNEGAPKVANLRKTARILQQASTGTFADAITTFKRMFGQDVTTDEQLGAAIEQMVLDQADLMTGVLSDTDIKILKDSVIGMGKSKKGNAAILTDMLHRAESTIAVGDRFLKYTEEGGDPLLFKEPTYLLDPNGNPLAEEDKNIAAKWEMNQQRQLNEARNKREQKIGKQQNLNQKMAQDVKQDDPAANVPADLKNTQKQITNMQNQLGAQTAQDTYEIIKPSDMQYWDGQSKPKENDFRKTEDGRTELFWLGEWHDMYSTN